jgi:hypothetical protein
MPKPILIIGVPSSIDLKEYIADLRESEIKEDYYIIIYTTNDNEFTFQVFYEKDFNEVKYEELKRIISDKAHKDTYIS